MTDFEISMVEILMKNLARENFVIYVNLKNHFGRNNLNSSKTYLLYY